ALNLDQTDADRLLLLTIEHGDIEGMKLALESGADAAALAANGWSALMLAALAGNEAVLDLLIRELKRGDADSLEIERTRTVGDDRFDVIIAALVGEGGGPEPKHEKVATLIGKLRTELFGGRFAED